MQIIKNQFRVLHFWSEILSSKANLVGQVPLLLCFHVIRGLGPLLAAWWTCFLKDSLYFQLLVWEAIFLNILNIFSLLNTRVCTRGLVFGIVIKCLVYQLRLVDKPSFQYTHWKVNSVRVWILKIAQSDCLWTSWCLIVSIQKHIDCMFLLD